MDRSHWAKLEDVTTILSSTSFREFPARTQWWYQWIGLLSAISNGCMTLTSVQFFVVIFLLLSKDTKQKWIVGRNMTNRLAEQHRVGCLLALWPYLVRKEKDNSPCMRYIWLNISLRRGFVEHALPAASFNSIYWIRTEPVFFEDIRHSGWTHN